MRRIRLGQTIALTVLAILLTACWPFSRSSPHLNGLDETCSAGATATMRYGSHPAVPVTRSMRITVPVGETIFVTFGGACPKGGRLALSQPGPGAGLNAFTGFSSWAGSPTHTWTPTEPGVRNLDVEWACTGPMPCPLGSLGVITVMTPR